MTRLKLSLTVSLLLIALASLNAEPTVIRPRTDKTKKSIPIENQARLNPNDLTGVDSNVQCFYLEDRLYFSFRSSEGIVNVSVMSAQIGREYTMKTLSLYPFSLNVGDVPGYHLITLTTSTGNRYEGEYVIEY